MSDTNWLACSVGWFKLCNVVLYLWSKAVVFTWHWELKHWHKSGLISASKSRTPNFYPVYWTWQSKLNPVQLFLNFLLSFIFMIQLKLYPYFPGLGWGGALNAAFAASAIHLFVMFSFTGVLREGPLYTPELSGVLWITPRLCWISQAIFDSFKEGIADCWLYLFFLLFSLKPREILICSLWNPHTSQHLL